MATVLIIEDENELVKVLQAYLEKAGFTVLAAARGDTGFSLWEREHPDLIILDLNLPGMDGLDVAREIRRKENTPIIMVTARVEETDRLIGLELGADDYVTKPYSPREIVARVRAVLRSAKAPPEKPQILRALNLTVDLDTHTVQRSEEIIKLTPTEFDLLAAMTEQPGRVFNRMQLLEVVQGEAYEGYERTIDAHIKNLRSKLEVDPKQPVYIQTVFGVGYCFSRE